MGSFDKKQKTSSQQQQSTTTAPQIPDYLQGPIQSYFGGVGNLINQNPNGVRIGPTNLESQALEHARSFMGPNPAVQQGVEQTRGLFGYQPQQVSAGQLADTDLTSYLNPYTQNVIDTGVQDLNRAREMSISSGQGNATLSGAFGGSRHGVADAETNRGFLDQVGSLTANLRSAGFQNAQNAALADIGNRLTADTANQGADLAGADLRLRAGNQAASIGLGAEASNRANQQAILNSAQYQRALGEANDPAMARMRYMQQISQLLGINAGDVFGQQIDSSGTSSGTSKSGGFGLGDIFSVASLFAGGK